MSTCSFLSAIRVTGIQLAKTSITLNIYLKTAKMFVFLRVNEKAGGTRLLLQKNATPEIKTTMRIKKIAILIGAVSALIGNTACDHDDSDDYSKTDPRIRIMVVDGLSTTFIINDVSGEIYNYDSLAYGTNIKSLEPSFYGYDVAPVIQYQDSIGQWVTFANSSDTTVKLDLTDLKIKATSTDGKNEKIYTVKLRVHKIDVNSFNWSQTGTLPVNGTVAGEKAVTLGGVQYLFYTNTTGSSYVLTSGDEGATWSSRTLDLTAPDWSTLATTASGFVVMDTAGTVYQAGTDCKFAKQATLPYTMRQPLFTLGGKFWAICSDSTGYCLCATSDSLSKLVRMGVLPSAFNVHSMVAMVAHSGTTKIGYVYSATSAGGTLWGIDANGGVMPLVQANGPLPALTAPALAVADNEVALIGGQQADGTYSSKYYSSSDAGITWTDNWHKTLPSYLGGIAGVSALQLTDGSLLLVGGRNAEGYRNTVWKATLK